MLINQEIVKQQAAAGTTAMQAAAPASAAELAALAGLFLCRCQRRCSVRSSSLLGQQASHMSGLSDWGVIATAVQRKWRAEAALGVTGNPEARQLQRGASKSDQMRGMC